jgi:polyisoprenoid-binding protein YceI
MNSLLVVVAAVLAQAPAAPRLFAVDAAKSTLGYTLVHKLHTVKAESKAVEARAALREDGTAQVMVRAAVSSFLSGDANRDTHMQEVMDIGKWPHVVLKGTAKLPLPQAYPAELETTLEAQLEFHGKTRPMKIPVKLAFTSAQEVRATGTFQVSLEAHEVERPSLLFVKVDDLLTIAVDVTLKAEASK